MRLIYRRSDQLEMVPQVIQEEKPFSMLAHPVPVTDEVYEAGWNSTMKKLSKSMKESL